MLNKLAQEVVKHDIKPEFEVFDTGHIDSAMYYVNKHGIPGNPHIQFVLGVGGSMQGTTENLAFLVNKLPKGATWSVTGIGTASLPMILTGLGMGADGIRVGLEDNLYMSRGVPATNLQQVERAVAIAKMAGREPATAAQAREILKLKGR